MTLARVFALLPAAGKSSRMGRPKLLLPLGGRTVLERVVNAFRQAGIDQVLVVTPPHLPELGKLAENSGAHVLELAEETADMRATVEHGLRWLEEVWRPQPEDCWLLSPADHPTLDPAVVRQLLEARAGQQHSSLFIPTFEGRHGHPALIGWQHVAGIRKLPAGQGLNTYLRQHGDETLEVPVTSADVLCDLDTPEDYERLLHRDWCQDGERDC